MNLTNLPDELKLGVLSYLNRRDLLNACVVNTELSICKDDILWRDLVKRDFGDVPLQRTWYNTYAINYQNLATIQMVINIQDIVDNEILELEKYLKSKDIPYEIVDDVSIGTPIPHFFITIKGLTIPSSYDLIKFLKINNINYYVPNQDEYTLIGNNYNITINYDNRNRYIDEIKKIILNNEDNDILNYIPEIDEQEASDQLSDWYSPDPVDYLY